MITGLRTAFESRCRERGYLLEEVRGCIVREAGPMITVDENHHAYPRVAKPGFTPPPNVTGPGTELKAMLKKIGITATPGCACNQRANIMDARGCDWCETNLNQISGWLAEEASKRSLPYSATAGKLMIQLAIRRARKKGNK